MNIEEARSNLNIQYAIIELNEDDEIPMPQLRLVVQLPIKFVEKQLKDKGVDLKSAKKTDKDYEFTFISQYPIKSTVLEDKIVPMICPDIPFLTTHLFGEYAPNQDIGPISGVVTDPKALEYAKEFMRMGHQYANEEIAIDKPIELFSKK